MAYRLLLDENVEHEVLHRLENYGHDVEHVDYVAPLGKGATDEAVRSYAVDHDCVLVTYDDDFVLAVDVNDRPVVYLDDMSLGPAEKADVLHRMSEHYPQAELDGVEPVGREWL